MSVRLDRGLKIQRYGIPMYKWKQTLDTRLRVIQISKHIRNMTNQ